MEYKEGDDNNKQNNLENLNQEQDLQYYSRLADALEALKIELNQRNPNLEKISQLLQEIYKILYVKDIVLDGTEITYLLRDIIFALNQIDITSIQEIYFNFVINLTAQPSSLNEIFQNEDVLNIMLFWLNNSNHHSAITIIDNLMIQCSNPFKEYIYNNMNFQILNQNLYNCTPEYARSLGILYRRISNLQFFDLEKTNIIKPIEMFILQDDTSKIALNIIISLLLNQSNGNFLIQNFDMIILNEIIGSSLHEHVLLALKCLLILIKNYKFNIIPFIDNILENVFNGGSQAGELLALKIIDRILELNIQNLPIILMFDNFTVKFVPDFRYDSCRKQHAASIISQLILIMNRTDLNQFVERFDDILRFYCGVLEIGNIIRINGHILNSIIKLTDIIKSIDQNYITRINDAIDIEDIVCCYEDNFPELTGRLEQLVIRN